MTRRRPTGQGSMPELVPIEGMNEDPFQALVCTTATENGWIWNFTRRSKVSRGGHTVWVTNTSLKGWPDLVLLHPKGYIMFLELKGHSGKPSDEQIEIMRVLQAIARVFDLHARLAGRAEHRFVAAIVWPRQWAKVERLLTIPNRRP